MIVNLNGAPSIPWDNVLEQCFSAGPQTSLWNHEQRPSRIYPFCMTNKIIEGNTLKLNLQFLLKDVAARTTETLRNYPLASVSIDNGRFALFSTKNAFLVVTDCNCRASSNWHHQCLHTAKYQALLEENKILIYVLEKIGNSRCRRLHCAISSVVEFPPLNRKVEWSIHGHWMTCRCAPWAGAFTSTAPAKSIMQVSAFRQLPLNKSVVLQWNTTFVYSCCIQARCERVMTTQAVSF